MRFKEDGQTKNEEPDSLEINFNFGDDNKNPLFVFLFIIQSDNSGEKKDKELIRREGLDNGHVKYNGKRTVNVETNDFSDLYYDLMTNQ